MEQVPKLKTNTKSLLIRKIDISSRQNKSIKNLIDECFTNTSSYFSPLISGNKIIVGKKLSKEEESSLSERINLDSPLLSSKKINLLAKNTLAKALRIRKKPISSCGSPMNRSLSSSLISGNGTLGSRINQMYNDSKSGISDSEIISIFERFKKIRQNNIKKSENERGNKQIKRMLSLQEQILKNQESRIKDNQKMNKYLTKKIKKKNNLLFNSVNNFRLFKEFREQCDDNSNNVEMASVNWLMQLRLFENVPGVKTCLFNSGTPSKPNWSTLYKKYPVINEKIREGFIDYNPDSFKSISSFYSNNETPLKRVKSQINCLNGVNVTGKSLLQAEIDNFKAIKGKKKIINYSIAECDFKEKEFAKSKSMKDLLGVNVVRSCMKIHDE